ncbi:Permease of the drug/metabolite transporter (DMT) superfamily [Olavius algarvensis associated proteobacterium Delta 3]|nr:Permease of the drug/metabolite transporter (DMT) superfamily [Olavius algarvensis associated proteobacterium Delta 3]CAB5118238.1 Permease of the drug/metabolite transporter (DMT) superfamily [Olavius algarvensis associated proteobacterium Delta 3]
MSSIKTHESADQMAQQTDSHLRAETNRNAHLWMVIFSVIIAGSFPVVAAITPGHDPTVLTFWRFFTATVIFGLMLPFVKGVRLPGWKDLGRYSVVGGSYGLFFILMFQSLKETSPLNTSTIYTTLPLMTMLLGRLVGEPIRFRQLWILALSMAACLWVIFRGDIDRMLELKISRGDWIFFLGTGCLAVYMLSMKKLQRDESKVCFTFYSLLIATLALLVAAVWRNGGLPVPDSGVWLGIAYLAGPSTAVTFWILQHTAPRLGPSRVVAYTFLTPSAVAAIEWGLGLSPPQWVVLPGIAITLLAVWLLQMDAVSGHRVR